MEIEGRGARVAELARALDVNHTRAGPGPAGKHAAAVPGATTAGEITVHMYFSHLAHAMLREIGAPGEDREPDGLERGLERLLESRGELALAARGWDALRAAREAGAGG